MISSENSQKVINLLKELVLYDEFNHTSALAANKLESMANLLLKLRNKRLILSNY